ncbi:MAG TPA: SDR family NAD(P)-dependent oxidoreductase [Kofleriaceae bacterium]
MNHAPRHVLITGAAGAIGGAVARAMRDAWPEARLALLDRDATAMADLARELGNATTHGADLAETDKLGDVLAQIERTRGEDRRHEELPLDGLVNCAGVMRVRDTATWEWDAAAQMMAINLMSPLYLQDHVVRNVVARGDAERCVIVNVASMAGKVPLKGCTYYGASKAGLGMASEIARADLAPRGVRVVTVYPGPVRSALEQGARDDYNGAGLFGRIAPTGEPDVLARLILRAIEKNEPRVIYPRIYQAGWSATSIASWFALSYGPPPAA